MKILLLVLKTFYKTLLLEIIHIYILRNMNPIKILKTL